MGHYRVDTRLSNFDTGGLVLTDQRSGELVWVFHGKDAGVPYTESGRAVNALDNDAVFAHATSSIDQTTKFYPGLDAQARAILESAKDSGTTVRTVSFSNGAPKQNYVAKTYGMPGVAFDGMAGPAQAKDMAKGLPAEVKHITTTKLSVLDTGT